jgi:hypothetical protein
MTAAQLLALAERVEGVKGPNYELERLIWVAIGSPAIRPVPVYTASIDAAAALIPAWWKLRHLQISAPCADDRKWNVQLHGGREGEDCFTAFAATPVLALAASALRARAAMVTGA